VLPGGAGGDFHKWVSTNMMFVGRRDGRTTGCSIGGLGLVDGDLRGGILGQLSRMRQDPQFNSDLAGWTQTHGFPDS